MTSCFSCQQKVCAKKFAGANLCVRPLHYMSTMRMFDIIVRDRQVRGRHTDLPLQILTFDEAKDKLFKDRDAVLLMKDYMESGSFSMASAGGEISAGSSLSMSHDM